MNSLMNLLLMYALPESLLRRSEKNIPNPERNRKTPVPPYPHSHPVPTPASQLSVWHPGMSMALRYVWCTIIIIMHTPLRA